MSNIQCNGWCIPTKIYIGLVCISTIFSIYSFATNEENYNNYKMILYLFVGLCANIFWIYVYYLLCSNCYYKIAWSLLLLPLILIIILVVSLGIGLHIHKKDTKRKKRTIIVRR